ncbi:MAG: transposase domain-containing protein [Hyphomicrobiales bacterium]|nr:transposase domain-containing protein [Hyphomicrobiales bacterium]
MTNYLLDIYSAMPLVKLFCTDFVDKAVGVRAPQAWFTDVFSRIADHKINRIGDLLP